MEADKVFSPFLGDPVVGKFPRWVRYTVSEMLWLFMLVIVAFSAVKTAVDKVQLLLCMLLPLVKAVLSKTIIFFVYFLSDAFSNYKMFFLAAAA